MWLIKGRRTIILSGCNITCKTLPAYDYSHENVIFYLDGVKHEFQNCEFSENKILEIGD